MSHRQPMVLAVDDAPANLHLLRQILQDRYQVLLAKDGPRALELARDKRPDLILLDVMMPDMDGYAVCRALKADPATAAIPVIFVTALNETEDELRGFEDGAVDFITKPFSPPVVQARVRTHLSLVRTEELRASRLELVRRLGQAAEYKDNETGLHVLRMSHYAQLLGQLAGLDEEEADHLLHAATMHDIGKIGIPDRVLLKPGKLDEEEWAIMRRHPEIGAAILGEQTDPMLRMARNIALQHHEKFDGSGYPAGLAGEQIALAARIVAVADVFDALTSARPYKPAWPLEQALDLLREQRGKHFDPELVDLFLNNFPVFDAIRQRWAEH